MSDKPKRTKLEEGMLLLDPGGKNSITPGRPGIYTVRSSKVLVSHYGDCSARSTLTKGELPEGWQVINNRALAAYLNDNEGDFKRGPARPGRRVKNKGGGELGTVDSIVEDNEGRKVMVLLDAEYWQRERDRDPGPYPIPYHEHDLIVLPKEEVQDGAG